MTSIRYLLVALILVSFGSSSAWSPDGLKRPTDSEVKKRLTPLQYRVTREEGTERPFDNEYWNNHDEGIYVDIISGEPLFSSKDKYDSKTGWPSFTQPLVKNNLVEREDRSLFTARTEVRSKHGDNHLGHVFKDGPPPTGLRYCMNSAAMRFIPKAELSKAGYAEFASLFESPAAAKSDTARAVFAGGCFWCMQPPFDKLKSKGVISSKAGYIGGTKKNPTYEEVSHGRTGHLEAVEIIYDPKKISYGELLKTFWVNVDPFDDRGQFCDKGEQYLSAIFALDDEQKKEAQKSLDETKAKFKNKSIATTVRGAAEFYPAEEYHQDYYLKNPIRYKIYRGGCGRDKRLEEVWGKAK